MVQTNAAIVEGSTQRTQSFEKTVMPAWIAGIRFAGCVRRHPCQPRFQHSMLERRNERVCLD